MEWLFENWKLVREDRVEQYRVLMSLMPLARSPMDKKSASALQKHAKSVERMLEDAVPWQKHARRSTLAGKVRPGEVVVVLSSGETADDPLYSDAKVTRE